MRTVSNLLWPAGAKLTSQASPGPAPALRTAEAAGKTETASSAEDSPRAVDDHELLRKLLAETSQQLGAIDGLKDTFNRLVDPLNNILSTLEREKADNARSQDAFAEIRSGQEALREELQGLERKTLELERDNERLRRELESARRGGRDRDDDPARLSDEVAAVRMAMSVIVRQLGEEARNARTLSEERGLLAKRADSSDQRIAELEALLMQARDRLAALDHDKNSLQATLEKSQAEFSRTAQKLTETESALQSSRGRLQETESTLAVVEAERNTAMVESSRLFRQLAESQSSQSDSISRLQELEKSLAEAEAERKKLSAACDDANDRRQKEGHALRLELHELRSRFEATEQFLAEARQNLTVRTEEAAAAEARLLEASLARSEAEKKLGQLAAGHEGWKQHTAQLEHEVASLTDRCKALSESLSTDESLLDHANEKIKALTGQVEQIQSDSAKYRARADQALVQLNAELDLERRERARVESALERARNDYARLQRLVVEERSMRRSDHQRRAVGTNSA